MSSNERAQKVRMMFALVQNQARRVNVNLDRAELTRYAGNDWALIRPDGKARNLGMIGGHSGEALAYLRGMSDALALVDQAWHENGVRT